MSTAPLSGSQSPQPDSHISILPSEVLGRVFAALPDRSRCSAVPLVSKEWRRIHGEHPPQRDTWSVQLPIRPSMLRWYCSGLAASLETLVVSNNSETGPGLLSQLLTLASVLSPKLREVRLLRLLQDIGPLLDSLVLLEHIQVLLIDRWSFPQTSRVRATMQRFEGLRSLKSINLNNMDSRDMEPAHAHALWSSLATLKHLEEVHVMMSLDLTLFMAPDSPLLRVPFFFDSISLLTQLRRLQLGNISGTLVGGALNPSFSGLTRLTSLWVIDTLAAKGFRPILSLLALEHLALGIADPSGRMTGLPAQSERLTELKLKGLCEYSHLMLDILPAGTPALPSLRVLSMTEMGISDFPDEVAGALSRLTKLDLGDNKFLRLPPVLSKLTSLCSCRFYGNNALQLARENIDTLAALASLEELDIARNKWGQHDEEGVPEPWELLWTKASSGVLAAIRRRLPRLKLTPKKLKAKEVSDD